VPAPTFLLHGADSPVVPPDGARRAAGANPAARLVEIPGAGHMVFWDTPDLARAALRDALTQLVS